MKRTISVLILILAAVYMILAILGRGDEYAAEKLFYRAMSANEKIVINPDVAPPKLLASVERGLQRILEKYPKTNTAKSAQMALVEFYIFRKKYDEALSVLNAIIGTENQNVSVLSRAHFIKGLVYEKQDKWNDAIDEYVILRDNFTDTALGLQMPLYIGRYYSEKGSPAEAQQAYSEAVNFYDRLQRENRGKVMGYAAETLLSQAYIAIQNYEEAGRVVEDIIKTYPTQQAFMQELPIVEMIFVNVLKRPEKAIEIYRFAHEKTNDQTLKDILQKKIEQLEAK